jgi:hypothetical protein
VAECELQAMKALRPLMVIALLAGVAHAEPAQRSGFTLELGAGLGHTRVLQAKDPASNFDEPGLIPLAAGLGYFFTNRFAVLFRTHGQWIHHNRGDGARFYDNQFLGPAVEYWVADDFAISAASGFNLVMTTPVESNLDRGWGVSLRMERQIRQFDTSALSLGYELNGSLYLSFDLVMASTLFLEWQRF